MYVWVVCMYVCTSTYSITDLTMSISIPTTVYMYVCVTNIKWRLYICMYKQASLSVVII